MRYTKLTKRNFYKVIFQIGLDFEKADKEDQIEWLSAVDTMLNDLLSNDFFGTEGQNDPRGDHRE